MEGKDGNAAYDEQANKDFSVSGSQPLADLFKRILIQRHESFFCIRYLFLTNVINKPTKKYVIVCNSSSDGKGCTP